MSGNLKCLDNFLQQSKCVPKLFSTTTVYVVNYEWWVYMKVTYS